MPNVMMRKAGFQGGGRKPVSGKGGGMPRFTPGKATPQQKMMAVAAQTGLQGLDSQQGTTRVLYDSLPLNGSTTYTFFENPQTSGLITTNRTGSSGLLNVGESMTLEEITFQVITTAAGEITNVQTLTAAGLAQMYAGQMSISIAGQQVMKNNPLTTMLPAFNLYSKSTVNEVYKPDSILVIPPNVVVSIQIRVPANAAVANSFLRCTIKGFGTLLNLKSNL